MVWTVNLLCTELETRLSPPLLETNTIDLHGCPISVERQTIRKVPGPEALIFQGREQCRKRVEIRFLTPTAFKQAGRYAIFPQERLLLQSLLGRWNYLCPDYPLTDEDAISALLEGIHIVDYALRTTRYRMKDTAIPGFCGKIQVEAKLPLPLLELWGALVCLAPYGGIGIKTTLGMGGTQISFQRENRLPLTVDVYANEPTLFGLAHLHGAGRDRSMVYFQFIKYKYTSSSPTRMSGKQGAGG